MVCPNDHRSRIGARRHYPRTVSTAFEGFASTRLGQFFGSAGDDHPGLSGFSLLSHGREAFIARLALADLAERSLDMQYYMWDGDTTGRIVVDHVMRAADRGRQGKAPCRRSILQGQRFHQGLPRCSPQCRDPSVQPAHQPAMVDSRLHFRFPPGQSPHAQQIDGCRQCSCNCRWPQYR